MREISHDAYARESLVREKVRTLPGNVCSWCGQKKSDKKGAFLFAYGIEPDDAPFRRSFSRGLFCSVSCYHSFNS